MTPGGYVEVVDRLRVLGVEGEWLYAAGDVNGRALLTHQGKYQARLVGDIIAGRDQQAWVDHRAVPRVTFTDPQVAAVGSTEQQARDAGMHVKTVHHNIGATAGGALAGKGVQGTAQLVIDQDRRVIVGRPSSVRGSVRCCTPPPSRSSVRSRSTGSGTPSRRIRPSARCGCGCSKLTAATLSGERGVGGQVCRRRRR